MRFLPQKLGSHHKHKVDLQMWDMYVPLTGKPALSYNFEEAKKEAKKALCQIKLKLVCFRIDHKLHTSHQRPFYAHLGFEIELNWNIAHIIWVMLPEFKA